MKGESICHGRSTGAACQLKDFSEWWLQKPRRHHRPTSGKLYAISKLAPIDRTSAMICRAVCSTLITSTHFSAPRVGPGGFCDSGRHTGSDNARSGLSRALQLSVAASRRRWIPAPSKCRWFLNLRVPPV